MSKIFGDVPGRIGEHSLLDGSYLFLLVAVNEIPCSDHWAWLLEHSRVKRKAWTAFILGDQGLSSFVLHVLGILVMRGLAALSDCHGLCKGTVSGWIIYDDFSHTSISWSCCCPTSDLRRQWKGGRLGTIPVKDCQSSSYPTALLSTTSHSPAPYSPLWLSLCSCLPGLLWKVRVLNSLLKTTAFWKASADAFHRGQDVALCAAKSTSFAF